jgi:serine/threonine-protein kinase
VPLVEGIFRSSGSLGGGTWWYAVSDTGTLVYQPGLVGASSTARITIAAFDRAGKAEVLKIPPGPYTEPRVSPDGSMLAYGVDDGRDVSIWVFGMAGTASPRRLTFGGRDRFPAWSADSRRVIFQSDREGDLGLFAQPADGSGSAVRLTTADKGAAHVALSASPDGAILLFDETRINRTSLMAYSFKDRTSAPYGGVASTLPTSATFSPNGRWVAFAMRGEGQPLSASFVQPHPATGAKFQISANAEDGHHQTWSRDGKEIFYTPGPGSVFVALAVDTDGPTLSFGPAPPFPRTFANQPPSSQRPFDTWKNANGQSLIIGLSASGADPSHPERVENRVVLNWFEELKSKVK